MHHSKAVHPTTLGSSTRRLTRAAFTATALCAALTGSGTAQAFGGEDPADFGTNPHGSSWHHQDLTEAAARKLGFSVGKTFHDGAAGTLAWNADYIDSYLYNPLWWAQGGIDRFKVSRSTAPELEKCHFDDLFSSDQVGRVWQRYTAGTLQGLLWAKENDDVAAAHNILAISMHALEDFYSHSNWIDAPERRTKTWFELTSAERKASNVWTGAYEHPEHLGVKHHGKYAPACTLLKRSAVTKVMDVACNPVSPLSNSELCVQVKECKAAKPVKPNVFGVKVPGSVVYMAPAGIALDTTWMAEVGVKQRGLKDLTGRQAFDTAKGLAQRSVEQWLGVLERRMQQAGAGAFWEKMKKTPVSDANRQAQYENYSKFPYTFLSAGPYPQPDFGVNEYYLRLVIQTSNDEDSGTNSDIVAKVDKKYCAAGQSCEFVLDYMPKANPLLAYNDFERGDVQTYTIGPFTKLPDSFALENRSKGAGEVLKALGKSIVNAFERLGKKLGDGLLSLVGGHADLIGTQKLLFTPEQLAKVSTAGQGFTLEVKGGADGHYQVTGKIKKVADSGGDGPDAWSEFSVSFDKLKCVKEGKWDRGSDSDEPFVIGALAPLPGATQGYLSSPFGDVDSGESRNIGHTFKTVRVPKKYGMLNIPISIMESDDEGGKKRNELLQKFLGTYVDELEEERGQFLRALGASIAEDWKVARVSAYGFNRAGRLKAGNVLNQPVNDWIEGKQSRAFKLNGSALKDTGIDAGALLPTLGADGKEVVVRPLAVVVPLKP